MILNSISLILVKAMSLNSTSEVSGKVPVLVSPSKCGLTIVTKSNTLSNTCP